MHFVFDLILIATALIIIVLYRNSARRNHKAALVYKKLFEDNQEHCAKTKQKNDEWAEIIEG